MHSRSVSVVFKPKIQGRRSAVIPVIACPATRREPSPIHTAVLGNPPCGMSDIAVLVQPGGKIPGTQSTVVLVRNKSSIFCVSTSTIYCVPLIQAADPGISYSNNVYYSTPRIVFVKYMTAKTSSHQYSIHQDRICGFTCSIAPGSLPNPEPRLWTMLPSHPSST